MAVSLLPGKSGKKSLDAELNLVPFIDLLVCCICFLLITAVWVQLAHVKATLRAPGGGGADASARSPRVLVGEQGYVLSAGSEQLVIPKQGPRYDTEALGRSLRVVRARLAGPQQPLTVAAEDAVAYRHLIAAMDVALGQGFMAIQVSDDRATL